MTDVQIIDGGSIVQFIPETSAARQWFDENVQSESWQWMGTALCVEHRCAENLVQGLVDAGFEVSA
jgi:hypothetical protein